jgi:hypothetical protein
LSIQIEKQFFYNIFYFVLRKYTITAFDKKKQLLEIDELKKKLIRNPFAIIFGFQKSEFTKKKSHKKSQDFFNDTSECIHLCVTFEFQKKVILYVE